MTRARAQGERLVIFGQGYVGLPLAIRGCEAGFDVTGIDTDEARVAGLAAGRSFTDDLGDPRLQAALASGRYRATVDVAAAAGFDHAVISVPTPLRDGNPDLHYIEDAGHALAPHLRPGCTVVLESTTYPGTTEELLQPILEAGSGLRAETDFALGYSPERIDPGNTTWTFETTPKIVSGVGPTSLAATADLYGRLVSDIAAVSSTRTAELAKLLENTFRHVNIALVNELAMFANDLGVDIWEAVDAAATKPFGYMRFTPGPGVGGHCLPIDPSYLSWQIRRTAGATFRFVELANDVNDHMPDYVVQRLTLGLNDRGLAVKGRRILVLGMAYKRNTGDVRESPFRAIATKLLALGANVRAADPYVSEWRADPAVAVVEAAAEEIAAADAVLVLVDHDRFDLDLVASKARYVFDTRRCVKGPTVEYL